MIRLLITLLVSVALTGCNEIAFELARAAVEEARKASEAEATNTNTQIAAQKTKQKKARTSIELESERQKRIQLEQQLAELEAQQEKKQHNVSRDKKKPIIKITNSVTVGPQGTIEGFVQDNTGIAEVLVDGQLIEVDSNGVFLVKTYVPQNGVNVSIKAVDLAGLTTYMSVRLDRAPLEPATNITFESLDPLGRNVASKKDALAIIVGIANYKSSIVHISRNG